MFSYKIRVRTITAGPVLANSTYLWGGPGVAAELPSDLWLTFRVDDDGEDVKFGTRSGAPPAEHDLGILRAGEAYSIRLDQIRGVWAKVNSGVIRDDTDVWCTVHSNE